MALSIVKGLLQQYVQSLFDEGIVNDQFLYIQSLKTVDEPDRQVQLVNEYCTNVGAILVELGSYIDLPNVDFSRLIALSQQVEERSSCLGVENIRLACGDLIDACHQLHRQNFFRSLNWIQNEFIYTRKKLEEFVQIGRKIARLKNKRQK